MKNTIYRTVIASSLFALLACGSSTTGPNPNIASRSAASIGVSGGHLIDASGFALYETQSACTAACLTTWPPLMASVAPTAVAGASQAAISLSAGQVTYNGHLLYYFQGDGSPGQTNGSGIGGFSLATP